MPITPSTLDAQQILQNVYDESAQALRTDATVMAAASVKIEDGTTATKAKVKSDGVDNALVVTQNSQPLPTGAATEAKQDTGNVSLSSIDTNTSQLDVALSTRASEVTLSSLEGKDFATETTLNTLAKESGGNLDAIKSDLDILAGTVIAGKVQVDAVLDASDIEIGAVELKNGTTDDRAVIKTDGTDFALVVTQNSQPLPTGASTEATLSSIDGKIVTVDTNNVTIVNGAAAAAVNIQDGGNTITVDAASLPLPTGAATEAKQDTGNTSLASIDGNIDTTLSTRASEVTLSSIDSNIDVALSTRASESTLSALNTKVVVADTDNVTIVNAAGAAAVNIQDGGNSITVDGTVTISGLGVTEANTTISRVSSSASSVQLLASNTSRKMAVFYNDSTASCFLKFGTTASATSFTYKMAPASTLSLDVTPIYNGRIDGIWDSANGAMQITESV